MNVEALKIKRGVIEERFENTKSDRELARSKVVEYDVELNRLQGEYRLVSELILDVETSTKEEEDNEPK